MWIVLYPCQLKQGVRDGTSLHDASPNKSEPLIQRPTAHWSLHYMQTGTRNRDGEVMKDKPLLRGKLT